VTTATAERDAKQEQVNKVLLQKDELNDAIRNQERKFEESRGQFDLRLKEGLAGGGKEQLLELQLKLSTAEKKLMGASFAADKKVQEVMSSQIAAVAAKDAELAGARRTVDEQKAKIEEQKSKMDLLIEKARTVSVPPPRLLGLQRGGWWL
jgi:hypothetical protein